MNYKKVGSLWIRKSTSGKTYLSGVIKPEGGEEIKISVWKNDKGDNPKRPDYVIQAQVEEPPPPPPADEFSDADEDAPF